MTIHESIIAALPFVGGLASGVGVEIVRQRFQRGQTRTQVSGEVHRANLEFDEKLMDMTIKRLEQVELRLADTEKAGRERDKDIFNLKVQLERVGNVYEAMRKLQKRVAQKLRDNKPIEEETLVELENAPDFAHVLLGPSATSNPNNGPSVPPT